MDSITSHIEHHFPQLCDEELLAELAAEATLKQVPAGTTIMDIGSTIKMMPLVTRGAIKVMREDDEGNELLLYFLYPGQSCAMSVQCCMAHVPSQIRAIAEDDTEMIAIPVQFIDKWMQTHASWRNFILQTYSNRFNELLQTVDSVVFQQLDERLLAYLQQKAQIAQSPILQTTHQDIAYDLHSSREVISRLLKQLEKHGKIKLGRNKIELV